MYSTVLANNSISSVLDTNVIDASKTIFYTRRVALDPLFLACNDDNSKLRSKREAGYSTVSPSIMFFRLFIVRYAFSFFTTLIFYHSSLSRSRVILKIYLSVVEHGLQYRSTRVSRFTEKERERSRPRSFHFSTRLARISVYLLLPLSSYYLEEIISWSGVTDERSNACHDHVED